MEDCAFLHMDCSGSMRALVCIHNRNAKPKQLSEHKNVLDVLFRLEDYLCKRPYYSNNYPELQIIIISHPLTTLSRLGSNQVLALMIATLELPCPLGILEIDVAKGLLRMTRSPGYTA